MPYEEITPRDDAKEETGAETQTQETLPDTQSGETSDDNSGAAEEAAKEDEPKVPKEESAEPQPEND